MKYLLNILLICFLFTASPFNSLGQSRPVEILEHNIGFHTITEALDYLKSQNISSSITIQLNARNYLNEPGYLNTFGVNMNGYPLTIQGFSPSTKSRILMDGTTPHVIDNHQSNFTLRNLILEGADPSSTNGSILRQKGNENNIRLDHVDMIGGYCGIRATTKINGLYLSNITSSRVPHGTFRLGNGSFSGSTKDTMLWERDSADYDMYNVEIKNITMYDDLNNEDIPGVTEKYNGFLLLKKIYNLTVDGIKAPNGNGGGIITVENSRNVVVKNVKVTEFGFNQSSGSGFYIFKSDHVEVFNNLIKTQIGDPKSHVSYYFNVVDNLSFCHNTAIASRINDRLVFGFQVSHVNSFEANLIKMKEYACILEFRKYDGYQASMSTDWVNVDFNAMSSSSSALPIINLEDLDGRNYIIMHNGKASQTNQINFLDYQNDYNRGNSSSIAFPENAIEFVKHSYYQIDQSLGRNIVSSSSILKDINGYNRSLPSDAGAYDADNFFDIGLTEQSSTIEKAVLYPNPTQGNFTIEVDEYPVKQLQVEIFDVSGKSIGYSSHHETSGSTTFVKISLPQSASKGTYSLNLKVNDKRFSSTFILE